MAVCLPQGVGVAHKGEGRHRLLQVPQEGPIGISLDPGIPQQVLPQKIQTGLLRAVPLHRVVGPQHKGHPEPAHVLLHGHVLLPHPIGQVQELLLHRGLVVPEHHQDGGLRLLGEVVDQLLKGPVRLIGQGQILLRHGIFPRRVCQLHPGGVVLRSIAAMVLDGHVKQKQRLPLRLVLKLPYDLLKVGAVADIAVLHALGHIHVLPALELVEAQPGIGPVPLPGGPLPRMERQGAVSCLPQERGHRGGIVQDVLLIGDAP